VAKPLLIGSWAVTFALMMVVGRIEESWRKQKERDLLNRLVSEVWWRNSGRGKAEFEMPGTSDVRVWHET
jgi:hypothetical protein